MVLLAGGSYLFFFAAFFAAGFFAAFFAGFFVAIPLTSFQVLGDTPAAC
ncbi:MAG: hypothetical protein IH796_04890 [Deltaproteobacteria bacterium]|nr:hypothetical protein [Deltaproteobacteria bacterium]